MAQPRDAASSNKSAPAPSSKSPNGTASAPDSSSLIGRLNLGRFLAPRPAAGQADGQQTKRPGFGRLLFAMLIFIVVAQLGEYLLFFLNGRFPQWRLVQATVVPDHSFPLLGGMSRFTFIYLIIIVALYFALYRFNVFPKDPFGAKARAQQQRAAAAATRTASVGASGTRAQRRHASRHVATTSTTKAPSARQVAAQARATVPDRNAGISDSEYERVKAAHRQRRRRGTKR